jgi:hypothetical protein
LEIDEARRVGESRPRDEETSGEFAYARPQETVLVEAPTTQVEACLADLQADRANFLAVQVDEPALHQAAGQLTDRLQNSLTWRQYNRGQIDEKVSSQARMEQLSRRLSTTSPASDTPVERDMAELGQVLESKAGMNDQLQRQVLRARRATPQSQKVAESLSSSDPVDDSAPSTDPLQVLFVLSADEESR